MADDPTPQQMTRTLIRIAEILAQGASQNPNRRDSCYKEENSQPSYNEDENHAKS